MEEARRQGHKVVVAVDGDHRRVVSIDGKKYRKNSSEGNNDLRRMMGEELTQSQQEQRRKANVGDGTASGSAAQRTKHKSLPGKAPKLTAQERKRLRKMNAKVRKTGKGFKMTMKQARNLKKRKGKRGFDEQLKRRETASKGAAYNESIDTFIKDLDYIDSMYPERAKYTKAIRSFLNKHGRVGQDGRYRNFKGHYFDDAAFHRAVMSAYKLSYKDVDDSQLNDAFRNTMDGLKSSVRVEANKR